MVLDRLASGSRDRYLFQRQFQALTARGRATAFALAAAVPILLLIFFLLDSERFTEFMQSGFGAGLVAVAIVLEIIGAIWIYRILKIDY
jgi:tight adherence protein B